MKLVFATHNKNKVLEVNSLIPPAFQVISLDDLQVHDEIPETSDTLEGNALLKARYVSTHFQLDCFSDDSGLEVDALDGAPGVYSARYAGEHKNNEDNIRKLLDSLQGKSNRKARFRTVIALILHGKEHLFEGIVEGTIIHEKRGTHGFGYDPVFIPDGCEQTFAEMDAAAKNKLSHRAKAMKQLVSFLAEHKA